MSTQQSTYEKRERESYAHNCAKIKYARIRAKKEPRGARGQPIDTWLIGAIEQEAPTSKVQGLSGGSMSQIDNTNLSPEEVAKMIQNHFSLEGNEEQRDG